MHNCRITVKREISAFWKISHAMTDGFKITAIKHREVRMYYIETIAPNSPMFGLISCIIQTSFMSQMNLSRALQSLSDITNRQANKRRTFLLVLKLVYYIQPSQFATFSHLNSFEYSSWYSENSFLKILNVIRDKILSTCLTFCFKWL